MLAYAVGEEGFIDLDGDGVASKVNRVNGTTELIDANGQSTDLPEAYLDANENGARDAGETFIDFNSDNTYNTADGSFNGVLCDSTTGTSSAGTCSAQRTIHVFRNMPMVFSGSDATISFYDSTLSSTIPSIDFPVCTSAAPFTPSTITFYVSVWDENFNVMPAGTTIAFSTSTGTLTSAVTTYTVPDSTACLSGAAGCPPCPAQPAAPAAPLSGVSACSATALGSEPITFQLKIKTAVTQTGSVAPFTCTVPASTPGILSVTVTTPKGVVTRGSIDVNN